MKYIPLVARIFLALVFLNAAFGHLTGFAEFAGMLDQTLFLGSVLAAGTIAFQFLGALSLILGYKTTLGAVLLIVFLVPATLIFHNFIGDSSQLGPFLKNLGLIGGLLLVMYTGAGPVSLDKPVG